MSHSNKKKKSSYVPPEKKEEFVPVEKKTIEPRYYYPDIEFNKKERKKTVLYAVLLIFFVGGTGLLFMFSNKTTANQPISMLMGALMLAVLIMGISMIPNAFKTYPIKNEPLITITPKEIIVNKETIKVSDISSVRLTYTLAPVSKNQEENKEFLQQIAKEEPDKTIVGDLDFVIPVPGKKDKTVYSTVACAYDAILALYAIGIKRYKIVYSMKKLVQVSEFDLTDSVINEEEGTKLSDLSKKERQKQLF